MHREQAAEQRRTDGRGWKVSGLLPLFHAGGPGCRDCQRVVNYLNQERRDGNGCICHTSS